MMEEIATRTESADLLLKLARPLVADYPHMDLQKSLIETLEKAISGQPSLDKYILFVGAFELTFIPNSSEVASIAGSIKLQNLPSVPEADGADVPTHALGTNLNGFGLVKDTSAATDLIRHALITMGEAGQLDYLRSSGIVGEDWKILVEIHYYRERSQITHAFHKDTYGQTLFVNLNYDTDHAISGPEYILNPAPVEKHEVAIAGSLPGKFLNDLKWVRGRLGEPSQIHMPTIPANGFVAFVDEAIHHMTPYNAGRTVKGHEVDSFLVTQYGKATVDDARNAYTDFRWQNSEELGAKIWSFLSAPKPFGDFLKVISKQDAAKWSGLIEVTMAPEQRFGRADLLNAGLSHDEIDMLFAASAKWRGYQEVDIPHAGTTPLAKPPLKRQASVDALHGNLPKEVTGNRRFFRTWIRAVRVPKGS